jgi:hypothetical protein
MIWRYGDIDGIMRGGFRFESQIVFMSSLYYSRNILEYILGSDHMTDLPLDLIVQTSLEITLDPNLIIRRSNLSDDILEFDKIIDDITFSLYHLLQLIMKDI